MLGHSVPFGHIKAVNMTQDSKLLEKRIGYLASSLFLHDNHQLNLLLVSSYSKVNEFH